MSLEIYHFISFHYIVLKYTIFFIYIFSRNLLFLSCLCFKKSPEPPPLPLQVFVRYFSLCLYVHRVPNFPGNSIRAVYLGAFLFRLSLHTGLARAQ